MRYFWTAKRTGGSLLFFANKCIFVSFYVLLLVAFAPFPSEKVCQPRSSSSLMTFSDGNQRYVLVEYSYDSSLICILRNSDYQYPQLFAVPTGAACDTDSASHTLGRYVLLLVLRTEVPDALHQVFSTLRSYVLSRSMLLAGLVLVLSMSPVGANLVSDSMRPC